MLFGANLASLSFVGRPSQMLKYVSQCLDLYKTCTWRGIPEKHVYEVLRTNGTTSITLGTNPSRPHGFGDVIFLSLICQLLQPKQVFEIGTGGGFTTLHLALNTPLDCKIYSLDLGGHPTSRPRLSRADRKIREIFSPDNGYAFNNMDVASKITTLFGDSASFDYSEFYEKIDFFFIDGAHSYEGVRSDSLNALKCCHPGSVIAWHDFGRVGVGVEGVSRWIVELSKRYKIYAEPGSSVAFMTVP